MVPKVSPATTLYVPRKSGAGVPVGVGDGEGVGSGVLVGSGVFVGAIVGTGMGDCAGVFRDTDTLSWGSNSGAAIRTDS